MCTCFLSHRPQLQIASSLKEGTVHYNSLCPIITLANQVFKMENVPYHELISSYLFLTPHSLPFTPWLPYFCTCVALPVLLGGLPSLLFGLCLRLSPLSQHLYGWPVLYQSSHFTWIPKTYLPVSPLKSNLPSLLSHPRWCIESLYLV